jgi:formamidopyrimidine-DNA glycosylase
MLATFGKTPKVEVEIELPATTPQAVEISPPVVIELSQPTLSLTEEQKSLKDFGNEGLVCPQCGSAAKRMGNCAIYCTSCKQTTRSGCGE